MTFAYVGEASLTGIAPLVANATLPAFSNLNSQLTAALALQASLSITPPTLAATIVATEKVLVNLQAAASAGLPNVSFNLSAVGGLIALLNVQIAYLRALQLVLSAGNVFLWTYDGAGNGFGPAFTSALATNWPSGSNPTGGPPSTASGFFVTLGTLSPASWTALYAGGPAGSLLGGI